MDCPICQAEVLETPEVVEHNNRGQRCNVCWRRLNSDEIELLAGSSLNETEPEPEPMPEPEPEPEPKPEPKPKPKRKSKSYR